MAVYVI